MGDAKKAKKAAAPVSEATSGVPADAEKPRDQDVAWMTDAIRLGASGHPPPNPHVGVLIVKDGLKSAEGHHERAGEDHAEVVALKAAGDKAAGATLYVSLEPCNHVGRTPPCTDAILAAKLSRVVIGCADPNPHVAGGGVDKLRASGVDVTRGVGVAPL